MYRLPNRALVFALAAFAATAEAQAPTPAGASAPYVVTHPDAVRAAESLFQAVQALAAKVTPCVGSSGAGSAAACICKYRKELKLVQDRLRATRSAYPDWETRVVNWAEPTTKQSRAISIQSLVGQSNPTCRKT
jgi:hypothetical protein